MGSFYASLCGTQVLQLDKLPPPPAEFDGVMRLFNFRSFDKVPAQPVAARRPSEHNHYDEDWDEEAWKAELAAETAAVKRADEQDLRAALQRLAVDARNALVVQGPGTLSRSDTGPVTVVETGPPPSVVDTNQEVDFFDYLVSWSVEGVDANLRFETAEQAAVFKQMVDAQLLRQGSGANALAAEHSYNSRPVNQRGWPTFEVGAATTVVAHLDQSMKLLKGSKYANASGVPKLLNINPMTNDTLWTEKVASEAAENIQVRLRIGRLKISGNSWVEQSFDGRKVTTTMSPKELLSSVKARLATAFFVGKGDHERVGGLLTDFEASMEQAMRESRVRKWQRLYQADPRSESYKMAVRARTQTSAEKQAKKKEAEEEVISQLIELAKSRELARQVEAAQKKQKKMSMEHDGWIVDEGAQKDLAQMV